MSFIWKYKERMSINPSYWGLTKISATVSEKNRTLTFNNRIGDTKTATRIYNDPGLAGSDVNVNDQDDWIGKKTSCFTFQVYMKQMNATAQQTCLKFTQKCKLCHHLLNP